MILLSLLALFASFAGTWFWIRLAGKRFLQDIPVARSSHSQPTVRGGGVVFVCVFLIFVAIAAAHQWVLSLDTWQYAAVCAMMLVGILDDFRALSVFSRLFVQIVAAACLLYPSLSADMQPLWFSLLLMFSTVWFINLYNFMDGIDGIATLQAISVALVIAGLCLWQDHVELAQLCGLLAAVMTGFLFWNFPYSRIFMGDSGSGALGIIFVLLMVLAADRSQSLLWACVMMMSVFILDASWTLMVRLFTGQKIWTAHKLHAYQILSRRWSSHRKVSLLITGYNLFWLAPLAFFYVAGLLDLTIAFALAWLPVISVCYSLKAGRARLDA